MHKVRQEYGQLEAQLRSMQAVSSAIADAAKPENPPAEPARAAEDRRTLSFEGTVRHGQRFESVLPGKLTFVLAPRRGGWDISLRQPWSSGNAVVVRPPAMNYGAGIIQSLPHIDLGDVRKHPPTQRFGCFAIGEGRLAEARRLVEALETNRRDERAWQEFMRLQERMGSYEIEFVKKVDTAGSRSAGGGALEFKVKLSVPENTDADETALR